MLDQKALTFVHATLPAVVIRVTSFKEDRETTLDHYPFVCYTYTCTIEDAEGNSSTMKQFNQVDSNTNQQRANLWRNGAIAVLMHLGYAQE